ncbi:restriction endonuclease subunit S [Glaesserella parasuis]|uniref:restriction endonuclease subunit S n=1 Tax=Glaesserella parasuis TaxID=738 RepID=UPI0013658376|nr:restriction endonuclease subunit S [Glaesserella parasuis]MCT8830942.1 restriction endonuclease subunit S [Glaesserella parasuis]MCT8835243.1 restriction endonuclease subunit S [Glaesserella parasuis]MDO9973424.1 restriction endonuclease subunit S [Glaesserella parasuis]MWQ18177.1 restriction endonuclease subunit S [Glaesserella parasuis]MWQ73966.1 restriction endonuclease subunit S [Glaesserella parasuis]
MNASEQNKQNQQERVIPKLRFPEFQTALGWKRHQLSEYSKIVRGGSPRPIEKYLTQDKEGLNWLKIGDVEKDAKYVIKTAEKVSLSALSKTREVNEGDFILSNSMSFGRPYILKIKTCIHDGWIAITNIDIKLDKNYLYYLMLTSSCQNYFFKNAAGSSVLNLNAEIIKSLPISLPEISEQQKIADCLSSLDELIELQEQKLVALKQHKKGLMQQLFPSHHALQAGRVVYPKLRFPQFRNCNGWKVVELGNFCKINPSNNGLPNNFIYIDLESVSSGKLVKKNMISLVEAPSRAQRLLENDDVIYQMVRPYQRNNYYYQSNDNNYYVASTGYAQLRKKDSGSFLFQLIHTDNFVNAVLKKCTGSNYPAINSSALSSINIAVPTILEEQQTIADCLSSLDNLINEQNEQIGRLKTHKKGLMQQLFPSI